MSKSTKKGGVLGRLLGSDSSKSDCCAVQIVEEPEETKDQVAPAPENNTDSSCCGSQARQEAPAAEARS